MKYTLGLDIGITSVGWCVINNDRGRIEDLNVRIFKAAENSKDGSSLAQPYRRARSVRRRLRRRAHRLDRIKGLLVRCDIISREKLNELYKGPLPVDVWDLRVAALERKLTETELVRVLIHIAKRRGNKSNKLNDNSDKAGVISAAIKENELLVEEKQYRTAGEMLALDPKFKDNKRNKTKNYTNSISREMLYSELITIFEKQRAFGNEKITETFSNEFLDLFNQQRPFATMEELLNLVGNCTFERELKRAPKASYSYEMYNLFSVLNNLRLIENNEHRGLSEDERHLIIDQAITKNILKYSDVRKMIKLPKTTKFKGLVYNSKKPEDIKFVSLNFLHNISCLFELQRVDQLLNRFTQQELNAMGLYLTFCKEESELIQKMMAYGFDSEVIGKIKHLSFKGTCHLSFKALNNFIPLLETGESHANIVKKIGYERLYENPQRLLPAIDAREITNPVVLRALSQSRKVINALIRKYGSPQKINIEVARELKKDKVTRGKMHDSMSENQKYNSKIVKEIKELFNRVPTGQEIVKYKLYKQQNERCLLSFNKIEASKLFDIGYAEVDHIIPYSRSFDDSYNNKILVLTGENREKGNRTPFEHYKFSGKNWHEFENNVRAMKKLGQKKIENLLRINFTREDSKALKARHLTDTQYISVYLANYLRVNLEFSDSNIKNRVLTVNGRITSYLRKRWGLTKNRSASDLHHAMDAAVIATVNEKLIAQITKISKMDELKHCDPEFFDVETDQVISSQMFNGKNKHIHKFKMPMPWAKFNLELEARLSKDPAKLISELKLSSYERHIIDELKPLMISRKPRRKNTGPAHGETIKSIKNFESTGHTVVKKDLQKIRLDKNGDFEMSGNDQLLKEAIIKRLKDHKNDPEKAFAKPLCKPNRDGSNGPIVKSVKVIKRENRVVTVHNKTAAAQHEQMVRVDVFTKGEKFYLVPIYVSETVCEELPNRAITDKKTYSDWVKIDDSYDFKFSLYKDELVKIKARKPFKSENDDKKKEYINDVYAYFTHAHSRTAQINIEAHDRSWKASVGSKRLLEFEKFEVDVLGNYSRVKGAKRLEFSKRSRRE